MCLVSFNTLPADVETCSGGARGLAGTLTILPTNMSLVTSPAKPVAQKTVAIKNNTARVVFDGSSSPSQRPAGSHRYV